MNQKLLKTLGIVMACFVVLILIIFIISSCSKKTYTYSELEDLMISATKNHYKNNEKDLPKNNGESIKYTLKEMIDNKEIKDLDKLLGKNTDCSGEVNIINNNGFYIYEPSLICKDYSTTLLVNKIKDDNLVTNGPGLHEYGSQLIFKGDNVNNYINFDGKLFRIMRINDDGTIRIIDTTGIDDVLWDYKYNPESEFSAGINDYLVDEKLYANLKIVSDNYYNNQNAWTDNARSYITTQNICIGKRSDTDKTKDGSTECKNILENQLFASIAVYEYLQASLDSNCGFSTDASCSNYNWLTEINSSFWTITALLDSTNYVYQISGKPFTIIANSSAHFNPVFNISNKVNYISGDGTEENPYTFR